MVPTRRPSLPVLAIAREFTEDSKITSDFRARPVSVTHASQKSCHHDCPFIDDSCYAGYGHQRFVTNRLNAAELLTEESPDIEIARKEASEIDKLRGDKPLRLHIVGDCMSDAAARIIAAAVLRYIARGELIARQKFAQDAERSGIPQVFIDAFTPKPPDVWTYTHAWRHVARASWGPISVLASCETPEDIAAATARGYACELTYTGELPRVVAGLRTIACPQQTGGKPDCASCLMCARDTRLYGRAIIALSGHAAPKKVAAAIARRSATHTTATLEPDGEVTVHIARLDGTTADYPLIPVPVA